MKTKANLEPLDINNIIERHQVDGQLYNGCYFYINSIEGKRSEWLDPILTTYSLQSFATHSIYYSAYDKLLHIKESKANGAHSLQKISPSHLTGLIAEVYDALTYVRITTTNYY